ncbi:MBOAT family O-acyltransferase [Alkalimarinus coralli]|uniref:MBOAT family O-acyltransferase n=1 Tax=Alkalimarinus coralli TaxID=2935863 RepID=UPI00202AED40|nr:MBOAT family protein [Alkalimarinus coralli]
MLFSSYEFVFLFLPVSVCLFFLISAKGSYRHALGFLTIASLFFYGWWKPEYLTLLGLSIITNYLTALAMVRPSLTHTSKQVLLTFGLVFNLGLIAYFKYKNFFVDNLNMIAGTDMPNIPVVLPLAISFFTFQQIAYLVDVYRDRKAERDFLKYSLFISYFPQLIAGPIVHHRELLPQLNSNKIFSLDWINISAGITIFSIGLFKKVVLADSLSPIVHSVFGEAATGGEISFFVAWGGALAYTLQLYFDFSGYSDMAIGAALMFNIHLPVNFLSPYKSKSIIEFWRRWHITLSHFLRDYLYIMFGGNRAGEARRMINMMATMLLGGLWHGAGWTFVLWGGLHGVYLVVNRAWIDILGVLRLAFIRNLPGYGVLAGLVTFVCVIVSWVLFRADNLDTAIHLYQAMFSLDSMELTPKYAEKVARVLPFLPLSTSADASVLVNLSDVRLMLWGLLIVFLLPNVRELFYLNHEKEKKWYRVLWAPNYPWAVLTLILLVISTLQMTAVSEFLYFQF